MFNLFFSEEYLWIPKVIIGLIILVILQFILSYVLPVIKRKTEASTEDWKSKIHKIFYSPIKILIWIIALWFIFETVAHRFSLESFSVYLLKIRNIAIILDVTWLLLRWKKQVLHQIITRSKRIIDKSSIEFVDKVISITIFFLAVLIILQRLGVNVVPIVTFGGIGAAAVALAAKDMIANFFGGLMLYITRPFIKGDEIDIPTQKIIGIVEHIGWYNTCIRGFDKIPLYVPNNIFSNAIIKNNARRSHRKIEEIIKVRYLDVYKVNIIIKEIKELIVSDENVDKNQKLLVFFNTFNDYSLDILIKFYTFSKSLEEFLQHKQEILLKINDIIGNHGAQMPFPITSVEFLNESKK